MKALTDIGIRLKNYSNGNHKTTCPKCSHTRRNKIDPCLSVTIESEESAVYNCHHCSFAGGTRGKKPEYRRPDIKIIPPSDGLAEYCKPRGISKSTLEKFGVFYTSHFIAGKQQECIAFPFTRGGSVINVKYRTKDKQFAQSSGAEKIFYGIDDITEDYVVIVEGEFDKLSLYEAGITSVISVPDGAPNKEIKEGSSKFDYLINCEEEISKVNKIILAVDNDDNGRVLEHELARRIGKDKCWRVRFPADIKDANEALLALGNEKLVKIINDAEPFPIQGIHKTSDFMEDIFEYYSNGVTSGISTGWISLDKLYTVRKGEVTVVTGQPGSGKSELIDALVSNLAASCDFKTGICSFENPKNIHALKLASKYYRKPYKEGSRENITPQELLKVVERGGWLDSHFFFITTDDEASTIDYILEKARIMVFRHGINGLIIDPYSDIEHKRSGTQTETEYVGEMMTKLRRFAQSNDVHIWFVAHPAKMRRDKDGSYPTPSLYDISGSANFVNKMDNGMVVERDYDSNKVTIHLKKVRFKDTGTVGETDLYYDYLTGCYTE